MVPTARLELARPKSLPPQDSVSTNSTTSAMGCPPKLCLRYSGMSVTLEEDPEDCAGAVCVGTGIACLSTTLPALFLSLIHI